MITRIEALEGAKIIPLKPYSKIPATKWNSDTIFEIEESTISYGIDTARSNLLVIDCDKKSDDENGVLTFMEICQKHNDGNFPDTLTVQTPNNGLHFYFKVDGDYSNSVNSVFGKDSCIDVRAKGGYVVGPGSLLKLEDGTVGEYVAVDEEATIQELPEWIAEYLNAYENKKKKKLSNNKVLDNDDESKISKSNQKEEYEQRVALHWASNEMRHSKNGVRNKTLNSLSYFMGRKRVPRDEALQLVTDAMEVGLSEDESLNTFNSGYEAGLKEEVQEYDYMVREYNSRMGKSFKDDPFDSEFYTNFSLSYNFWKARQNQFVFSNFHNSWFTYLANRGQWIETDDKTVKAALKDYLEELVQGLRLQNTKIAPEIYKIQEKIFSRTNLENVLQIAMLDFEINYGRDEPIEMDSHPYLINCKNGVFNLETKTLEAHDRNLYLTKYIPVNYIKDAKDNYCDKVLESIAEGEKDYLQILAGQALIGLPPTSQKAFFLHGSGSNGKSTFIDLLLKTSGDYSILQSPDVLLPTNGKEVYAMSNFEGLRGAVIEELPDSKQLNTGSLKRLVGTHTINSRKIYSMNRTFENNTTIFVTCNRLPIVNENDHGTWRRLSVISFPYSYKAKSKDVVGIYDRLGDPMVLFNAQKNAKTAEAFLAWRIEGALKWFANNSIENDIPETVEERVREWNENNDQMLSWLTNQIEVDPDYYILMVDAHDSYNYMLKQRGNSTLSLRFFIEEFKNHSFVTSRNIKYRSRSRIPKNMKQSLYEDPEDVTKVPRTPGIHAAFIPGIKFKKE